MVCHGSAVFYCFPIICFMGIESLQNDVGALLWLNAETLERAPTPRPLWQTRKVLHPWVLFCETTVITYHSCSAHVQYAPPMGTPLRDYSNNLPLCSAHVQYAPPMGTPLRDCSNNLPLMQCSCTICSTHGHSFARLQ